MNGDKIIIGIMILSYCASLEIIDLHVGIRGYTGGKPLLETSRRLIFPNLLTGAVVLTILVFLLFKVEFIEGAVIWAIFAYLCLDAIGRRIVNPFIKLEYKAFGFDDDSLLRKTLLFSLTNLSIPYEETSSGVRLPTLGIDLVLDKPKDFQSGQFYIKQRKFDRSLRRVIDDLMRNMNEHIRDSPNITFDYSACWWFFAGILLRIILAGVVLLYVVLQ